MNARVGGGGIANKSRGAIKTGDSVETKGKGAAETKDISAHSPAAKNVPGTQKRKSFEY